MLNQQGYNTIADFVCPTNETRSVFGKAFIIFIERLEKSKYEDTNKLFEKPIDVDVIIHDSLTIEEEVFIIKKKLVND